MQQVAQVGSLCDSQKHSAFGLGATQGVVQGAVALLLAFQFRFQRVDLAVLAVAVTLSSFSVLLPFAFATRGWRHAAFAASSTAGLRGVCRAVGAGAGADGGAALAGRAGDDDGDGAGAGAGVRGSGHAEVERILQRCEVGLRRRASSAVRAAEQLLDVGEQVALFLSRERRGVGGGSQRRVEQVEGVGGRRLLRLVEQRRTVNVAVVVPAGFDFVVKQSSDHGRARRHQETIYVTNSAVRILPPHSLSSSKLTLHARNCRCPLACAAIHCHLAAVGRGDRNPWCGIQRLTEVGTSR